MRNSSRNRVLGQRTGRLFGQPTHCRFAPIFREGPPMPLLRFIPETTNVDFVKYRWVAFAIDGLLVVVSVVSILWHGFNFCIDFTGGVLMEVKSAQVIDVGKLRGDIISLGFNDPVVQTFDAPGCTPAGS